MRCVLIHNPASGRNRHLRDEQLRLVVEILSERGHFAEIWTTDGPGSAGRQAREAAARDAEIVFACGGDGTVNEVLQGLVCEVGEPAAALGILPFGSANALARHLRIALHPPTAALQQVEGATRVVPVGKVIHGEQQRYFIVMAGAGPDGALAAHVSGMQKSKAGRFAYYLHAGRLFLNRRFHPFEVQWKHNEGETVTTRRAVAVLAARVECLGGLFSRLTLRHGSIADEHLQLLIVAPPAAISLPLWFLSGWLNLHRLNPLVSFENVTAFSCSHDAGGPLQAQVDGEWLGYAPIQVSVVPNALRLCVPSARC